MPFHEHLRDAGLGHISESFDGDAPYHPRGCMAQAWSVAELPRTAVEDVYGPKPPKREAMPASMTEASPKAAVIP